MTIRLLAVPAGGANVAVKVPRKSFDTGEGQEAASAAAMLIDYLQDLRKTSGFVGCRDTRNISGEYIHHLDSSFEDRLAVDTDCCKLYSCGRTPSLLVDTWPLWPPAVFGRQELRLLRMARHPNIVIFYGAFMAPPRGEVALVFERMEGPTLDVFMMAGRTWQVVQLVKSWNSTGVDTGDQEMWGTVTKYGWCALVELFLFKGFVWCKLDCFWTLNILYLMSPALWG